MEKRRDAVRDDRREKLMASQKVMMKAGLMAHRMAKQMGKRMVARMADEKEKMMAWNSVKC